MGHFFYSLLTAFFVGVDGSLHVLLIPNSRLSRKVAKNPIILVRNPYNLVMFRWTSLSNYCFSHRHTTSDMGLGACPRNAKIGILGGSKTPLRLPIVDSGAF